MNRNKIVQMPSMPQETEKQIGPDAIEEYLMNSLILIDQELSIYLGEERAGDRPQSLNEKKIIYS